MGLLAASRCCIVRRRGGGGAVRRAGPTVERAGRRSLPKPQQIAL